VPVATSSAAATPLIIHHLQEHRCVRAFITGIAGFAGSFLAEHLLACGDAVMGCSLEGTWGRYAPPALSRGAEVIPWDVAEGVSAALVRRVAEFAPEAIFHLAALSVPADCGRHEPTPAAIRVNIGGTEAVVELAAALPSRPRVLVVSSCRVYAPVDFASPLVAESAPLAPTTGYAYTKIAAEEALRRGAELGVAGIAMRAFNHAGPRQSPKLMLSEWCRQLVRGDDPLQVHCLDAFLDMTDVRDIVRAYRLLAKYGRPGEAYNVGGGVSLRSGDILEQLLEVHGARPSVVERSPGRRQDPIADLTKLQSTIDWRPEIPLAITLRDTLDFWSAHPSAQSP
jgi:GDP-4-dehydro-6-deoxy-D-mannose reductase